MKQLSSTTTLAATTTSRKASALVVRAVLLLAFGLVEGALVLFAFRIPHVGVSALVLVMAGFFFLDAAAVAVELARRRGSVSWLVPRAVAGVVAGALVLLLAPRSSINIFAGWALLTGALDIGEALTAGVAGRLVQGALSLALGVFVWVGVSDTPVVLLTIAMYAVVAGGLQLGAAMRSGQERR